MVRRSYPADAARKRWPRWIRRHLLKDGELLLRPPQDGEELHRLEAGGELRRPLHRRQSNTSRDARGSSGYKEIIDLETEHISGRAGTGRENAPERVGTPDTGSGRGTSTSGSPANGSMELHTSRHRRLSSPRRPHRRPSSSHRRRPRGRALSGSLPPTNGETEGTSQLKDAGNPSAPTTDGRPAIGIVTETETPGIPEGGSAEPATHF